MNGMIKIGASVFAKIIDFAFSGYGLVCDVVFLRILVQHMQYQYLRIKDLWRESLFPAVLREGGRKMGVIRHPQGERLWVFRQR